jgi:hypothetical protein
LIGFENGDAFLGRKVAQPRGRRQAREAASDNGKIHLAGQCV